MINPFAFHAAQVTTWTTIVYLALIVPIIVLNEKVPSPPADPVPFSGVNLTEAWFDLATLTRGYHPYNSHRSDEVRDWLLLRIEEILKANEADWTTETSVSEQLPGNSSELRTTEDNPNRNVTLFNDMLSNVTMMFSGQPASPASNVAAYFEGTNVLVYIRGTLDEPGEWWKKKGSRRSLPIGQGGVLVNAHYDSVATGFGATDNGMGVVSVLQLIKYFTTPGHQPRHGIVALLNNGEEDYLYGARAFGNSPLLPFIHTFLNLEGAGAGGRAILLRSTDEKVTSSYAKSPHPFGTVISSDSFGMGFIRSQTDYVIFNDVYGQRGLDVTFYKPRARYHTQDDDLRHTSRASLWHMLSAAVTTMQDLSSSSFVGDRADNDASKVPNGRGGTGVWFDLFGRSLVLFNLRGMFAWSLTLLIATPLILLLVSYLAQKKGKYYFFSNRVNIYEHGGSGSGDYEQVKIGGLKGIVRFPLAIVVSGVLVIGGAFLLRKVNPYIVHSSKWTVWAMFLSLGYFSFWCIMRGADAVRPSALHRGYVNIWLFTIVWILLVAVTVLEDRFQISSGYQFVFLHSALFLTTLISITESFALPDKKTYGQEFRAEHEGREHDQRSVHSENVIAPEPDELDGNDSDEDENGDADREQPSVITPLIGRPRRGEDEHQTTFATTYRHPISALAEATTTKSKPVPSAGASGEEQPWSKSLPTWTWFIQFLLMGPFTIILAAQTGLMLTDATHQTGTDGSNAILPYLVVALYSLLLIVPLMPFMHRITHHIPVFLFIIFVATLIYNLVAFPFTPENRFKAFWQQTIDIDAETSTIKISGLEEYVRKIIGELPSASGNLVQCQGSRTRIGTADCSYDGSAIPPNVANNVINGIPPEKGYAQLVSIEATPGPEPGQAKLKVDAKNTKSCYLKFAKPIKRFTVAGGNGWDDRFSRMPDSGVQQITLWRRDWEKVWEVDIEWEAEANVKTNPSQQTHDMDGNTSVLDVDELKARNKERNAAGIDGTVTCLWSDINTPGTIPALDEAIQYAPTWAVMTKLAAGLVEASKSFLI